MLPAPPLFETPCPAPSFASPCPAPSSAKNRVFDKDKFIYFMIRFIKFDYF